MAPVFTSSVVPVSESLILSRALPRAKNLKSTSLRNLDKAPKWIIRIRCIFLTPFPPISLPVLPCHLGLPISHLIPADSKASPDDLRDMTSEMVTALVAISPRFVATGDADSCLHIRQFDIDAAKLGGFGRSHTLEIQGLDKPKFPLYKPTSSVSLGKCSHSPVSSLCAAGNNILATSGSSASLWDVVSRSRVRHFATTDVANCADFVTPNLVAVAGNACELSLFDVRSHHSSPILSKKVALDNLYGLVVDGSVVYCGGADGDIHKVDLRNQKKETWQLWRKDAILDLKMAYGSTSGVVASTESGRVCCVDSYESDYKFSFDTGESFSHRIKCDVVSTSKGVDVACGGENGVVYVFQYDGKHELRTDITIGEGLVASVCWSGDDLFASTGSDVVFVDLE